MIENIGNKKYSFINYARFIAIVLITNSHFDNVYPWPISFGGAPGVALFFMITGFLLTKKPDNMGSFERWYFKRLIRIYPSMWLITIILVTGGYYTIDNYKRILDLFLYPTGFWYITAILELYLLFYLITKAEVPYKTVLIFVVIWYFYRYIQGYERSFFVELSLRVSAGLIAMLIGACLKQKLVDNRTDREEANHCSWRNFFAAMLSLGGFLVIKLLLSKGLFFDLQFLTHFFSIGFAFYFLLFMQGIEGTLDVLDSKFIGKIVASISACSLEIYMIQRWIIEKFEDIFFPINLLLIVVLIFLSGGIIHFISTSALFMCEKMIIQKRRGN